MRKRRTFVRRFLRCIFHQHILVRPVRFERMAFGVGAVLYEVFVSQRLLKRRSLPTFYAVFVCFLCLLGLPIFGVSSLIVAAAAPIIR